MLVCAWLLAGCGGSSGATTGVDAGIDATPPQQDAAPPQEDAPPQQDAAPPSGVGDSCTASGFGQGTCADGQICLSEEMTQGAFPGGYCTARCSDTSPCPADSACITGDSGRDHCMKTCTADAECRVAEGYKCLPDPGGASVCQPWSPPPGTIDGGACVDRDAGPQLNAPNRVFGASQQLTPPSGSMMEAETHVVAARLDGGVRVAAAYIAVFASGDSKMAVNTSDNGGQTFGAAVVVDDPGTQQKSDPVLAWSADHQHLFFTWIGYDYDQSGNTNNMHPFVARSDDYGATWQAAKDVGGADSNSKSIDKPWIATGPNGEVVATYMASAGYDSAIRVARSLDNGDTWEAPVTAQSASTFDFVNLAYPVVDGDGNLYVGWIDMAGDQNGADVNDVKVARWDTTAAWGTFAGPFKANTDSDEVVFNDVVLVAGQGAGAQDVYAVYTAGSPAGLHWDVRLAHSADRGATWAPSITVNDDPTCAAHFLPTAALDDQGRVHVSWYDNRFGTSSGALFYAVYDPLTHVAGPNQFLSDAFFEFTVDRSTTNWLGDYTGLSVAGTGIYASWSDPRGTDNVSHVRVASGVLP
jgi:hypothetical protein